MITAVVENGYDKRCAVGIIEKNAYFKGMKVLFDHSVRQHAIRGEHAYAYSAPYQTGYNNLIEPVHNIRAARTDWLQNEIDCLGKIAELCRRKILTPYITEELEAEKFRALKFPPPVYNDLFEGIEFEKAQCPIVRSKWRLCAIIKKYA